MELWDIYDAQRNKRGYTVAKGTTLKAGEYHLVVHVCVFNKNNEMLIQKRKNNKLNWPGLWDFSSGGAAISGENSTMAAERELMEELSINFHLSNERPVITVHFDTGFDDYYLIEIGNDIANRIIFNEEEIENVKWASLNEILRLIKNGEFGITKSFACLLFDMRNHRGNRT